MNQPTFAVKALTESNNYSNQLHNQHIKEFLWKGFESSNDIGVYVEWKNEHYNPIANWNGYLAGNW